MGRQIKKDELLACIEVAFIFALVVTAYIYGRHDGIMLQEKLENYRQECREICIGQDFPNVSDLMNQEIDELDFYKGMNE